MSGDGEPSFRVNREPSVLWEGCLRAQAVDRTWITQWTPSSPRGLARSSPVTWLWVSHHGVWGEDCGTAHGVAPPRPGSPWVAELSCATAWATSGPRRPLAPHCLWPWPRPGLRGARGCGRAKGGWRWVRKALTSCPLPRRLYSCILRLHWFGNSACDSSHSLSRTPARPSGNSTHFSAIPSAAILRLVCFVHLQPS